MAYRPTIREWLTEHGEETHHSIAVSDLIFYIRVVLLPICEYFDSEVKITVENDYRGSFVVLIWSRALGLRIWLGRDRNKDWCVSIQSRSPIVCEPPIHDIYDMRMPIEFDGFMPDWVFGPWGSCGYEFSFIVEDRHEKPFLYQQKPSPLTRYLIKVFRLVRGKITRFELLIGEPEWLTCG